MQNGASCRIEKYFQQTTSTIHLLPFQQLIEKYEFYPQYHMAFELSLTKRPGVNLVVAVEDKLKLQS
jgi:hypothetical protein